MNSKNPLVVPIYCGVALLAVIAAILGYRQWTLAAIREDVKAALPGLNLDGVKTELSPEEKAERSRDLKRTYAEMDKREAEIAAELKAGKETLSPAEYEELEGRFRQELDNNSKSRQLFKEIYGE